MLLLLRKYNSSSTSQIDEHLLMKSTFLHASYDGHVFSSMHFNAQWMIVMILMR